MTGNADTINEIPVSFELFLIFSIFFLSASSPLIGMGLRPVSYRQGVSAVIGGLPVIVHVVSVIFSLLGKTVFFSSPLSGKV